jgi:hypothetical protein
MSTELSTYNPTDDGWNDAASDAGDRVLRGSLLKFSDGRWSIGKEGTDTAPDLRLVAVSTTAAWVKWKDGKPVEYRIRDAGHAMRHRETLGDEDESEWEVGPDGRPKDPWQNTRFVHLIDLKTAAEFTFSTSSFGGRRCVEDLGGQISKMRAAHPGALPIVNLSRAMMDTKYGRKTRPVLEVVDWKRSFSPNPQLVEQGTATESNDISEEIPF